MTTPITLYVDPLCPWAYMTAHWMLEVEAVRDVTTDFRVMSLAVLNENRELSAEYVDFMKVAWKPVRLLIAAEETVGHHVVRDLYFAIADRYHKGEQKDLDQVLPAAIEQLHLPASLLEHLDDDHFDEALRASHLAGMSPVGFEVGTPVIHVGDTALFGPVVTPTPKGEAAGKLFDGVVAVATTPGFYELKRTRTKGPDFS